MPKKYSVTWKKAKGMLMIEIYTKKQDSPDWILLNDMLVWLFQMALPESLQLSESDCREQCTQEILYLFLLLEVKLHFLQARKVFQ